MQKIKLGDIAEYAEDRISVSTLNERNYISTENLLPNKGGITTAANLPPMSITPAFQIGDILISNIRQYFKKIWYANFKGGCSNDILVLRAKQNVDSKFLYYVLSEDNFFNYATATSKGTKMPRGDKKSIMNYPVPIPPLAEQKKIGAFLYSLDEKISLNKKINSTLEEMARTIFLHKFFRKAANGKLGEVIIENPKSTISVGDAKNCGGEIPFFTSGENILRWKEKLVDGRNIFLNTGGNAGINFYVGAAAYSTDTWSITAENLADYLYLFLHCIKVEIGKKFFKGTALKHLQKDLLRAREIYIPTAAELEEFNHAVAPSFTMISKNLRENYQLAKTRDFLLPLLMNGQVGFKEELQQ